MSRLLPALPLLALLVGCERSLGSVAVDQAPPHQAGSALTFASNYPSAARLGERTAQFPWHPQGQVDCVGYTTVIFNPEERGVDSVRDGMYLGHSSLVALPSSKTECLATVYNFVERENTVTLTVYGSTRFDVETP